MTSTLRRFISNAQDGVAYLEFAICLPFLLSLFMGAVELTRYTLAAEKVEKTAVTLSNVASEGQTISRAELDQFIYAASQVMLPFSFGPNGYVIISSVTQTGAYSAGNPPKVNWQYTSSGVNGSWVQPSHVGSTGNTATLPGGVTLNDKDNVIVTEVFYNYHPMITPNGVLTGGLIYQLGLYRPRLGALNTLSALPYWLWQKGALI